MKIRYPLVLVTVASLAGSSMAIAQSSAQNFEGAVTMRLSPGRSAPQAQAPQEVEYAVRGGNVRVTMAGPMGSMSMLALPDEEKVFVLMSAQNAYMELPMSDARAEMAKDQKLNITRTGKKEMIAGYECEHVLVSGDNETVDMCLTNSLGSYVNPLKAMNRGTPPSWQRTLERDGGFPLQVKGPDGAVVLEVTKVEKKKMPLELFSVPGNYTKMQVPVRR